MQHFAHACFHALYDVSIVSSICLLWGICSTHSPVCITLSGQKPVKNNLRRGVMDRSDSRVTSGGREERMLPFAGFSSHSPGALDSPQSVPSGSTILTNTLGKCALQTSPALRSPAKLTVSGISSSICLASLATAVLSSSQMEGAELREGRELAPPSSPCPRCQIKHFKLYYYAVPVSM